VFSEGARALALADAIVICVEDREPLPDVFYRWVNLWLGLRERRGDGLPGALIALIGRCGDSGAGFDEMASYFHAVAQQGELELLLRECDPLKESGDVFEEELVGESQTQFRPHFDANFTFLPALFITFWAAWGSC
jgi:hypothetical protein